MQQMAPDNTSSESPIVRPSRVCDRCIKKKAKCDQIRPTCSRCFEYGETCVYTSIRRKPGPQRGSHRGSQRPLSSRPRRTRNAQSPVDRLALTPNQSVATAPFSAPLSTPSPNTPGGSNTSQNSTQLNFTHAQEEQLYGLNTSEYWTKLTSSRSSLTLFFDTLLDVNPIFSKERFFRDHQNSVCSQELIYTIVTITAKLTGSTLTIDNVPLDGPTLDAQIDRLLSSSMLEVDLIGDSPSLDQFRKSCILAFYEFHQFPGNQSWMRIGRLTRMAYRVGLDRLENLRTLYPEWKSLTYEETQEWRAVWWFIYRLDSYSNISSGTPFLIDDSFINTALVLDHTSEATAQELFLPPDASRLWEILPVITSNPETCLRNIHIVAIAVTRRAGIAMRIHPFHSQDEIIERLFNLERHLPTLRLALPSGWFSPRRNAFLNESNKDHHLRLNTVLVLLMSKLLFSVLGCSRCKEDEWLVNWQKVIETCQDIASTAAEWDSSFCLIVDPAVCFVIFAALIFLDVHKKSIAFSISDAQAIESDQTILRLHLEQFARFWTLPRLLSMSFSTFSQTVPGPFHPPDIALILSRFEAPLHPRWLQFLASAQSVLDASQ